jgi:hypothetical protein
LSSFRRISLQWTGTACLLFDRQLSFHPDFSAFVHREQGVEKIYTENAFKKIACNNSAFINGMLIAFYNQTFLKGGLSMHHKTKGTARFFTSGNLKGAMALLFCLIAATMPAQAATIDTLFNTGVDSAGNLIASGIDPHYTISQIYYAPYNFYDPMVPPASSGTYVNSTVPAYMANPGWAWVPSGPNSSWISYASNGYGSSMFNTGVYFYQTTFDLTGLDPASVQISGLWGTDDPGWMYLNLADTNVPDINNLVVYGGGFSVLAPFSISGSNGLFRQGLNTLTFVVWDAGNAITGLRMDISSATANVAVPEPGTLMLLCGGLLGLLFSRRSSVK